MLKWNELIVSHGAAESSPLGRVVEHSIETLDRCKIKDGRIVEWPAHFLSGPMEHPQWDTPKVDVDWDGFLDAIVGSAARCIVELIGDDDVTYVVEESYRDDCTTPFGCLQDLRDTDKYLPSWVYQWGMGIANIYHNSEHANRIAECFDVLVVERYEANAASDRRAEMEAKSDRWR